MYQASRLKDMTEGRIVYLIVSFSIPLLLGNLFQQLYTTVDTIIVGKYVGKEALAAVGSTTPLVNTLLGFFMGLASGASIVTSQFFGAKQNEKVNDTVHTVLLGTIILAVLFTIVGVAFSPLMLRLMNTPDDVMSSATEYLQIFFGGVSALMVYNMASGLLRALGDSLRPLIFLIITSIINVVLDILFVVKFNLGIAGVAYATVICEIISAILVLTTFVLTNDCYKFSLKKLRLHASVLKAVVKIGLPSALQMAITSFSNVFVQRYINYFGSSCMAGWTAYNKIDQLVILPVQSISIAASTFVGQNFGANNLQRVKKGISISFILSIVITAILLVPILVFAPELTSIFNKNPDVLYYGVYFLRICSPFYLLLCVNQIFSSALRGLGQATVPTIIMLSSFVAFRQVYLNVVTSLTDAFFPVSICYPAGWTVCSIAMLIYYFYYMRKHYPTSTVTS